MILGVDLVGTNIESGTKTFNINLLNQFLKKKYKNKINIFICKNYLKYITAETIPKNINLIVKPNFLSINFLKIIWMQIIFPLELIKLRASKVYSPMNYCPLICKLFKIQIILTVHSNLPWIYFDKMPGSKLKNFFIKKMMQFSINASDKLIVNSKSAKKELSNILKIRSKKIFVNYLGVADQDLSNSKKISKINFNFNSKYILSVSSCVRYHDFYNILKAFKKINNKKKIKIVFIMQILDTKYYDEIKAYVDENFKKGEIYFFKNLRSSIIKKFYKNSFFYIFSSYCEVFGLTTLEAMQNKCPVLVSNFSALPEINGNAVLYFDPNNYNEIYNKMNKLIKNNNLRKLLINRGQKHVSKFKWSSNYNILMKIIER